MGLLSRNVKSILSQEADLFKRIGMEKVGYEGFNRGLEGGTVWYIARFADRPTEYYTIAFESFFGQVNLVRQRLLNPKLSQG